MGQSELSENLGSVMGEATRYARWNFLPQNPTLKHYIEVLLDSPEYFVMFWNSIKVVMGTLVGQCTIAIPAAWGFAVNSSLKKFIFPLYHNNDDAISGNNAVKLFDSETIKAFGYTGFPDFFREYFQHFQCLLCLISSGIPPAVIEAARIDGAREWDIFLKIRYRLERAESSPLLF